MSNVFTLRICLVYVNYTFSFFSRLIPGGDKKSHILKQTCSFRSARFASACMTFYYYQAMKINDYNFGTTF